MKEEWRPIIGYEGVYDASNFGRIRRVKPEKNTFAGRIMRQCKDRYGYPHLKLCKDGERKGYGTHTLIIGAFVGPCPVGKQVNHKDGDKTNNCIENLEYVTQRENNEHAFRLGLKNMDHVVGERHYNSILTERDIPQIRRLIKEGEFTRQEIGTMYGVSRSAINNVQNGHAWSWLK